MAFAPQGSQAVKALTDAGVLPKACKHFEMILSVNKPCLFRYEVFATEEQVQAIANALRDNPEEAQRIAKEVTLESPFSHTRVKVDLP